MTDLLGTAAEDRVGRHAGAPLGTPSLDTWQDAPHNRWGLSHVEEFVPTARIAHIRRDDSGHEAGASGLRMPGLRRRLEESYTDAFVVARGGEIVVEHYRDGFAPTDRHLLMSVSKSICGLLVGTIIDDGLIDPAYPIAGYVPALAGSAYGDATVQQVLDMTVDVDYDEDYRDPASHVQTQDRVAGWRSRKAGDAADTYAFLTSLRGSGRHGRAFRYCSAGTDVLAWLVERVTGQPYADAVSERIWSQLGCTDDATITVDANGCPFANGGISCTARDLVRVGQLMLSGGSARGTQVVSSGWVDDTLSGGDPALAHGTTFQQVHPKGSYRNQWWSTGNERGNVYAIGIHGQFIWLDALTDTVIVKFSSWPEPVTEDRNRTHAQLFREVCEALDA